MCGSFPFHQTRLYYGVYFNTNLGLEGFYGITVCVNDCIDKKFSKGKLLLVNQDIGTSQIPSINEENRRSIPMRGVGFSGCLMLVLVCSEEETLSVRFLRCGWSSWPHCIAYRALDVECLCQCFCMLKRTITML